MNFISFVSKEKALLEKYSFFYGSSYLVFFVLILSPFVVFYDFPNSYITIKWVITLLSINGLMFLFLLRSNWVVVPKISRVFLYILGIIFIFIFINASLHNVPLVSYENMRRFAFWGAALFFFNLFLSKKEEKFQKIMNVLYLVSFVFLIAAFSYYVLDPTTPPYLTFGNTNIAAEFIGFSLAFQFGSLVRLWRKYENSFFLEILCSLSLTYLYFTFCRSIIIALFLIIFCVVCLNKKFFKNILKILFFSICIFLLIKICIFLFSIQSFDFLVSNRNQTLFSSINNMFSENWSAVSLNKNKSIPVRWTLYFNTLKMILENPLGVGIGQFEFASLPYMSNLLPEHNETKIFLSPHSEFLHCLVEDGVVLSLLFFCIACIFIYSLRRDIKDIFLSHPEFIFFSVVLFIQSLFQFPLLNPLPYFLIALMVGYFFSLRKKEFLFYRLSLSLRAILLSATLFSFVTFIISFSSIYISFNFPRDLELNKIACSFGNRDWFACLNLSSIYLEQGNFNKAKFYAVRTLEWQPFNFQGIKILGFIFLYQGNRKKACPLFEKFDAFFQNQSSLRQVINTECFLEHSN